MYRSVYYIFVLYLNALCCCYNFTGQQYIRCRATFPSNLIEGNVTKLYFTAYNLHKTTQYHCTLPLELAKNTQVDHRLDHELWRRMQIHWLVDGLIEKQQRTHKNENSICQTRRTEPAKLIITLYKPILYTIHFILYKISSIWDTTTINCN